LRHRLGLYQTTGKVRFCIWMVWRVTDKAWRGCRPRSHWTTFDPSRYLCVQLSRDKGTEKVSSLICYSWCVNDWMTCPLRLPMALTIRMSCPNPLSHSDWYMTFPDVILRLAWWQGDLLDLH
jgi:hypothetical protein